MDYTRNVDFATLAQCPIEYRDIDILPRHLSRTSASPYDRRIAIAHETLRFLKSGGTIKHIDAYDNLALQQPQKLNRVQNLAQWKQRFYLQAQQRCSGGA